ncbi:MAG: 6-bladed beta-propeller [Candidatus Aminicenantaceae bacterium]
MKKLYLILPLALILCFVVGCQDKEAKWQGTIEEIDGITVVKNPSEPIYGEKEFQLEEDLVIGEGEEDEEPFLLISHLAVDDEDNIYVSDTRASHIRVFDKNGNPLRTIGRKGEGPGELMFPRNIQISSKGELMVQARVFLHFFSLQGEFLGRLNTRSIPGFEGPIIDSKGNIIACEMIRGDENKCVLKKFDSELNPIITLTTRPLITKQPKVNYWEMRWSYNPIVWGISKEDSIIWGDRTKHEIYVLSTEGKLIKKITRDCKQREMTGEDKKRLLDEWFDGNPPPSGYTFEFPKYFPAFANFVCDDDGSIFIETYEETEDRKGIICGLFDSQGRYIARILLRLRNFILKKGKLYTIEEDKDGYYCVKRYIFAQNI